jgi:hypothetical protein
MEMPTMLTAFSGLLAILGLWFAGLRAYEHSPRCRNFFRSITGYVAAQTVFACLVIAAFVGLLGPIASAPCLITLAVAAFLGSLTWSANDSAAS